MVNKKITLIVLSTMIILLTMQNFVMASSNNRFKLHRLSYDSSRKEINWSTPLYSSDDFDKVKKQLSIESSKGKENLVITDTKNLSPLQIVAADRAYVQTYPYRDGSKTKGSKRALFSRNIEQTNGGVEVPAYHLMHYQETYVYNNALKYKVSMAGKVGFIESEKVDVIPLIYVDKKVPVLLGGNASKSFANGVQYQPYTYTVEEVPYYQVKKRNGLKEITVIYPRTTPLISDEAIRYGLAPDWMDEGKYYSMDGIFFYKDRNLTQIINKDQPFYAYYQWLPLRTPSNYSVSEFKKIVNYNDSVIKNKEYIFAEIGNKYGINPILLMSQAIHETSWGRSPIARDKNNLFGWNAIDDNSYIEAKKYDTVEDSIEEQAAINLKKYLTPGSLLSYGQSFGNKESGISVKYATDPYYGQKIAAVAYDIDRKMGLKDYNVFSFSKLKDHTGVPVYSDAKTTNVLYRTEGYPLINQIVVNLGEEKGRIKTYPIVPIQNGSAITKLDNFKYPFQLKDNLTYIDKTYVEGYATNEKPTQPTNPNKEFQKLIVVLPNNISHLNIRSEASTNSKIVGSLKDGDILEGTKYNNLWYEIKISGNRMGYVHSDYVQKYVESSNPKPIDPISKYKIGDVNMDQQLNVSDIRVLHRYLMGKETLSEEQLYLGNVKQLYSESAKKSPITVADIRYIYRHLMNEEKLKGWS